ncbi:diguanylate cyclase, partial [Pyxidicoccus fallax]|nr:diguanylate cyclase [Pyxidicoccus fallax]
VLKPGRSGGAVDWTAAEKAFRELAELASVPVKPAVPAAKAPAPMLPTEGVLLVVDEDAAVLAEAERLGRAHVVRVLTARTSDEARVLARRQWVDGALVHMHLGGPLGGIEAAHALRAEEGLGMLPLAFTG